MLFFEDLESMIKLILEMRNLFHILRDKFFSCLDFIFDHLLMVMFISFYKFIGLLLILAMFLLQLSFKISDFFMQRLH